MTEPGALLAAADAAASGGDLQTAERLLRDALALQETSLGPSHADVANTVNNLAVVCERLGKFDEAEQGYRRAHAIAVRALGPKHPFVATSLKNLVDFCATRGIPLWTPPATATEASGVDRPMPPQAAEAASRDGAEAAGAEAFRRLLTQPISALGLLAIAVIVVLIVVAPWAQDDDSPPDAAAPAAAASTPVTMPPPAPGRGSPPDVPTPRTTRGRTATDAPPAPAITSRREAARPSADAGPPAAAPARADSITVLTARVCTDFERAGSPDWRCTPLADASAPGVFTFYTRVAASSSTPIEHRWYRDGALHRTAGFSIPASGANGYRTFSRTTVSPSRAGAWRVELRTADGRVLHEQRFTVSR